MSCYITSPHVTSCHVVSCHFMWCGVVCPRPPPLLPPGAMLLRSLSCRRCWTALTSASWAHPPRPWQHWGTRWGGGEEGGMLPGPTRQGHGSIGGQGGGCFLDPPAKAMAALGDKVGVGGGRRGGASCQGHGGTGEQGGGGDQVHSMVGWCFFQTRRFHGRNQTRTGQDMGGGDFRKTSY